eukprot:6628954-Ditylum_brightwellii.AAC.1
MLDMQNCGFASNQQSEMSYKPETQYRHKTSIGHHIFQGDIFHLPCDNFQAPYLHQFYLDFTPEILLYL